MTSILRYPGGKSKVCKRIISHLPLDMVEYREPFVGGGGIFFAIPNNIKRWINDIHPGLVEFYLALRDRPVEFIKMCKDILPEQDGEEQVATKKNGKKYNKRLMDIFEKIKLDETCDQAFRYFFINRTVWMGRVNYEIASRLYFSVPEGWNIVNGDRLETAAEKMTGTRITCGDYLPVLEEDGVNVVIYCDPPYVVNSYMPQTDQQYQFNFTLKDHTRFVDAVKSCEHRVCISYDDCSLVREWFSDSKFKIHEEEWKYSGTSLSNKKTGKELIITNY